MDGKTIFIIVVGTIWTLFGASITSVAVKYLSALKKDKNLGLLATWAEQVVANYQKSGLPNEQKKENAVSDLTDILKKNKKLSLFSSTQIGAAIEVAVNLLNVVIASAANTEDSDGEEKENIQAPGATTTTTSEAPIVDNSSALSSEVAPVTVAEPIGTTASESQQ